MRSAGARRADPDPGAISAALVDDLALYTSCADLYDRIYYRDDVYRQAAELVLSELAGTERPRVLDLCAGTGSHARLLTDAVASVVGVDRSRPMLSLAARKVPEAIFVHTDVRKYTSEEQ